MSAALPAIIVAAAAAALIALNILLLLTIFTNLLRLWPTPGAGSWQHYVFWPLFRGGLGLTFLYALLTFSPEARDALHLAAGFALMVLGFGVTIYGYFYLGLANTYGGQDGLVTDGLYRYSRNPQYVASILGFAGMAIAHGGAQAALLCALAILIYILLPFAEEPWLAKIYGEPYLAYKRRTPRFLGF